MKKWYKISAKEDSAEISIFGDIGDSWWSDSVKASDFKKDFDAIKDKKSISLLINSPGGDVFDGVAIYNIVSQVRDRVTVEVLGWAASAASIVALSGSKLVMGEGSYLMIHNPWAMAVGDSATMLKMAADLEKMNGVFASIYSQHSSLSEDEVLEAMAEETWYTASEAVEAGFADEIADYGEIAACGDVSRYRYAHVPNGMLENEKPSEKPETIREFERFLRDEGHFSQAESRVIASHGFTQREVEEPQAEQAERAPNVSLILKQRFHDRSMQNAYSN